jgi:hypothetical protein
VVVAVFLVLMLVAFLGKVYSYRIINIVKEEKKKIPGALDAMRLEPSRAPFIMMLVLMMIVVCGGGCSMLLSSFSSGCGGRRVLQLFLVVVVRKEDRVCLFVCARL